MTINSKSTKAEILAAYVELRDRQTTAEDVWQWLLQTSQVVSREGTLFAKDCYRAGQALRRWYDQTKAELSRPIFKA
jgi:cytochrome b subunit of formate dehydrogenase